MLKKIIPIFVPHQGCPHDCIFCNQKKITGISTDVTGEDVREIIESYLKTIENGSSIEVAFFGGSFTAIDREKQIELLKVAYEYKSRGLIDEIRMSTRPDCIDNDILELVKSYGTSIIELGVQSMDEQVLIDSIRGHNSAVVWSSSDLIKEKNIKLGLQMMIGLPSDTEEKCIYTARQFVKIKPDFVRIYPTIVIKETGLEMNYNKGIYSPFNLEESVDIVKKLLVLFKINDIEVIRVGLQSTDDISIGKEIVAGPYHPAFGEMVQSRIIRDFIEKSLIEQAEINENEIIDEVNNISSGIDINKNIGEIVIHSSNKNISSIVGNKKTNRLYFNRKYNYRYNTKVDDDLCDEVAIFINGVFYKSISFEEIYREMAETYKLI